MSQYDREADALKVVLVPAAAGGAAGLAANANNELVAQIRAADQAVTSNPATGTAGTVSIGAPAAGKFIYITYISIQMYAAAALTGGATPVKATTSNLQGTPTFLFPTALAIGQLWEEKYEGNAPIKATAAATGITFTLPATTNVQWNITVEYFVA